MSSFGVMSFKDNVAFLTYCHLTLYLWLLYIRNYLWSYDTFPSLLLLSYDTFPSLLLLSYDTFPSLLLLNYDAFASTLLLKYDVFASTLLRIYDAFTGKSSFKCFTLHLFLLDSMNSPTSCWHFSMYFQVIKVAHVACIWTFMESWRRRVWLYFYALMNDWSGLNLFFINLQHLLGPMFCKLWMF